MKSLCNVWHIFTSLSEYIGRDLRMYCTTSHILVMDLGMFCTTSHILGETCECSAPLSTYWHGHANIMHLSAHIRKSMPIYCSTWHIFTGLSEYIRRSIPMFCYYWHGIRSSIAHSQFIITSKQTFSETSFI